MQTGDSITHRPSKGHETWWIKISAKYRFPVINCSFLFVFKLEIHSNQIDANKKAALIKYRLNNLFFVFCLLKFSIYKLHNTAITS